MRKTIQCYVIDFDPPLTVYEEPFGPSEKQFAVLSPSGKVLQYLKNEEELKEYGIGE